MSEETTNVEVKEGPSEAQVAIEKEARLLGWVPKEDFRDGDHWVDAETFVKRGKEINPILRKNNEILLKKLEASQMEIAEVKKVAKEFEKFQKEAAERKVAELTKELNSLKEQKKQALSSGDGEAAVALDDAIDALKEEQQQVKEAAKQEVKPAPVNTQELDPLIVDWMGENSWFGSDSKYTRMADAIGADINANYPNLRGKEFFKKLDEELAEVLPQKYQKNKTRSSPVESGSSSGSRPSGTKKQSYENLPSDAKAACDKFVKQGLMTKEQYVQEYDWS